MRVSSGGLSYMTMHFFLASGSTSLGTAYEAGTESTSPGCLGFFLWWWCFFFFSSWGGVAEKDSFTADGPRLGRAASRFIVRLRRFQPPCAGCSGGLLVFSSYTTNACPVSGMASYS